MASIQVRKETGCLIIDFYFKGIRCREQTALTDSTANRKKVQKVLDRIEADIATGSFEYRRYFPGSKNAEKFDVAAKPDAALARIADSTPEAAGQAIGAVTSGVAGTPLLREFAETWYNEKEVEWRRSHKTVIRSDLDGRIIPRWGEWEVGRITKADILAYRADLAKVQARCKGSVLSNRRINKLVNLLRQIINEAADRFDFRTPFQNIKQLKVKRTDVDPFTLDEVMLMLTNDSIRSVRNYCIRVFFRCDFA